MIDAIVGHLVGDYLLQDDWMAKEKKIKNIPCLVHCLIWTLCVCLFGHIVNPFAIFFLFITHFIQDRTSII